MILTIPLVMEEIKTPQKNTLRLLTEPDVLLPHNLYFYQETNQPDR